MSAPCGCAGRATGMPCTCRARATGAPCGCCEGIQPITPVTIVNRPGLDALAYRVGTYATFLETMEARLTTLALDIPLGELDAHGRPKTVTIRPLANLTTRRPSDPAIALLDSWATVAHVLTFYQERIANEGYLRTATERRSILELARLIGYTLCPGVAATVYLAYTLDDDRSVTPPKPIATTIPVGTRAQSVPGPGESPQSFETADPLDAVSTWNKLAPRLTQPQTEETIRDLRAYPPQPRVYLQGISTNLKVNNPLLIDFGTRPTPSLFRIASVEPDSAANRTLVKLEDWEPPTTTNPAAPAAVESRGEAGGLTKSLLKPPSLPPRNAAALTRDVKTAFGAKSDTSVQLLSSLEPALQDALPLALANSTATPSSAIRVYALRVTAAPFGNNAAKRMRVLRGAVIPVGEWPIVEWPIIQAQSTAQPRPVFHESEKVIYLDGSFDHLLSHSKSHPSWIVFDWSAWTHTPTEPIQVMPGTAPDKAPAPHLVTTANQVKADISRAEYGLSGKTTRIDLQDAWLKFPQLHKTPEGGDLQLIYDIDFRVLRATAVYAQTEELALAEEPIESDICDGAAHPIELARLYSGLHSGRWLIVSGERTDVIDDKGVAVAGVAASELVMLAGVTQDVKRIPQVKDPSLDTDRVLPGDLLHTFITLATGLAYCYKRDTVSIYGNVVKASHGETRTEVLGSGDTSQTLQRFSLKQSPLTFVSAPTIPGADSTLVVRVNDVEWHETDSLAGLGPADRVFVTRTDDNDTTAVIFGNGASGARLPTGQGNVKVVYRNGIGRPGNVKADQISILAIRPLGVNAVTNPIRASGGADRDDRDQARRNAPLAVMALDRLVSTQDYADFARTFAGIGKASAVRLSNGRRQVVHVTIAGAGDIPIEPTSDLYQNLRQALGDFGDPAVPIQLAVRELVALVMSANVRVLPDYQWVTVEAGIRAALLDALGFERRSLGQSVFLSELMSVVQQIPGVAYVDVDVLTGVSEGELANATALAKRIGDLQDKSHPERLVLVHLAETIGQAGATRKASVAVDGIYPAQVAYLTPDVPSTLVLNEVPR